MEVSTGLNDEILELQMEEDRIKWLKDIAKSLNASLKKTAQGVDNRTRDDKNVGGVTL